MRPQDRFDYWRGLHPSVALDPVGDDAASSFQATRLYYRTGNGGAVGYTSADDTRGHFQGAQPDFLLLSFVLTGATDFYGQRGGEVLARPGSGVLLIDSGASIRSQSQDCAHVYMTLPKRLLPPTVDFAALTGEDGVCLLPEAGLLQFVHLYLQELAASGSDLSGPAARIAVDHACSLAVAALDEVPPESQAEPHGKALFEAAMAVIRIRAPDVTLTADSLAQALGCSRALLYRIFADRDLGIGQQIRAARIARARALLEADSAVPIKVIARQSGYENAAAFARAFRRDTGISPVEYRLAWRQAGR